MHHGQYPYGPPQGPHHHQHQPRVSVTYSRKRTAHLWHLIATICTAGLWGAFVWLPLVLIRAKKRKAHMTYHY